MFGKMMEMKQQMDAVKNRLDTITVSASSSGDEVKVTLNGNKKLINVSLHPDLIARGDADEISELLQVAFNRAMEQAEQVNESEMRAIAGSLLPGLGGML